MSTRGSLKVGLISIILTFLFLITQPVWGQYSGGIGTPDEPWQISCTNDLLYLASHTEHYGSCFILTSDINLADYTFTIAVIAPDMSTSNDFQGTAFRGVFDGNGHKISNLTIDDAGAGNEFQGLFGLIVNGEVRNLGVENSSVSGSGDRYIGGMVGYNRGSMSNCYFTGSVLGINGAVGGFAGRNFNDGSISNCYFSGNVTGNLNSSWRTVGGLTGDNYGLVSNCYSTGSVNGNEYIGGLVGRNYEGRVLNCYSSAIVSGNEVVGGLVGYSFRGSILRCYSTGSVRGTKGNVGGLIGINGGSISNCYSTGSANGAGNVGGLAGLNGNGGSISNCYSTGSVSELGYVGGLVGGNTGSVSFCFWDINTSGTTTSYGGTGLPTEEMQMRSTFKSGGWDFNTPVWVMWNGHEYPWLAWEREPVMVESISIVDRERVGRTVFRYLCKVTLWNTRSQNFLNVSAELVEVPENVSILDGVAGCSYIEAHTTAETDDTFQIEVDRSVIINPANMVWSITYELADGSLQQSLYINNFDFLPSILSGDITGDRIINAEDLAVLANQWLQLPGVPSADIAPEPQGDGFVNFLDLAVLANEWLRH